MNKHKIIPLRGKRFLSEENVDSMLAMAMDHECPLPICNQWATTHAAGCSVAGMVVRAMRANLNFLQNQVDICWGELMHERDFRIEKLDEHIDIMGALNLLLFTITSDRISTLSSDSRDGASETENILTRAFDKLPKKDLRRYNKGIIRIRQILEEEILLEMMELRDKIREDKESGRNKNWKDDIQMLLHMGVGPKLASIYEELETLTKSIGSIIKKVRIDWKTDLRQIEADKLCAPSLRRKWKV